MSDSIIGKRGGKRPNAGRPRKSDGEQPTNCASLYITPSQLAELDRQAGDIGRSRYVVKRLKLDRR